MNCAIYEYIEEYCTILKDTKPVAKKAHTCCECKREIVPKEQYRKEVIIHEGKMYTYKTCLDCVSIRNELFHSGFYYETVLQTVHDNLNYIAESCIVKLTPRARDMICDMIDGNYKV